MKKVLIILVIIVIVGATIFGFYAKGNWILRFKSELDTFFGNGKWEVVSEETKDSIIFTEKIRYYRHPELDSEVPGKYKNWNIKFINKNNEEEIWTITNHTLKINNDKYGMFSSKRYSQKQAFIQQLMDISLYVAGEDIKTEILKDILPENELNCIDVYITYKGGNPKPNFYNKLFKESWFNSSDSTAEKYLTTDLYDFYIYIRAFDYRVEKLTESEKENLLNSLDTIINKLLEKYGNNASFEIYLDKEHRAEYKDGKASND